MSGYLSIVVPGRLGLNVVCLHFTSSATVLGHFQSDNTVGCKMFLFELNDI